MIDTASQIVHNADSLTQHEDTKMNDNQEQNVVEQGFEDQTSAEAVSEVEAEIRANLHSLSQDYQLEEVITGFFFVAQDILDRIGYELVGKEENNDA